MNKIKANIGDKLRDPSDGETFVITRIYKNGKLDLKCIVPGAWDINETDSSSCLQEWLDAYWELIPSKEANIKKLLDAVDKS